MDNTQQGFNQQQAYQQPYQQGYQEQPYQQCAVPEAPAIGFGEAISRCFKNYATFSGRATRAEFWWWQLFSFLVGCVLGWIPILGWLVTLALFLSGLAVAVRRLHDIGKAGGFWFIYLIPLVGSPIFYLIWNCTKSEPQDNRFGPYLG